MDIQNDLESQLESNWRASELERTICSAVAAAGEMKT